MEIGLREIAEAIGGIIVGLLSIVYRNLVGEVKAAKAVADAALPRADFVQAMSALEKGRQEFREGQIKLFERMELHTEVDTAKFESLSKDFNGGLNRIADTMNELHIETLRELNKKADK
jgi:hypothetical protein